MEIKEISNASTQVVALEIQGKEEGILYEKDLEPMPQSKEGSVEIDLVGNRVAESEKETSFSGNSGVSQSAAGRGEDSSDENADTNQDFSVLQKQMFNQIDQETAVQNNSRVLYSGTNTDLNLLNIGVHMPETHLNLGMDLNVSSVYAIRTEQECEKLRETAEMLNSEISELPNELRRLSEECGKLDEKNSSLIDEMGKMYGPDAVADLRAVKVSSSDDGSNSIESKPPRRDNSTSPTPSHRNETFPTPSHRIEASPIPLEPRLFGVTIRPNSADYLRN
ncbi:hypothetical protein ACLB2K_013003 [Fragaria x ananassa]